MLRRLWMDTADEPQLVRIALAVGDREGAESAVADADRRAEFSPGVPSLEPIAAHPRALIDGDPGELSEPVGLFERSTRLLAHAAAWEDLGLAHQGQGIADSGIDALTEALVLFARAGATRDAARLRSRLQALGVRRRVAASEKPARGWAAMAKSELPSLSSWPPASQIARSPSTSSCLRTRSTHICGMCSQSWRSSRGSTSRGLRWSEAAITPPRSLAAAGRSDLSEEKSHGRASGPRRTRRGLGACSPATQATRRRSPTRS